MILQHLQYYALFSINVSSLCWMHPHSCIHSFVVDLSDQWRNYRAARKALENILTMSNIQAVANQNFKWCQEAKTELETFLTDGILTESFVLHNLQNLVRAKGKRLIITCFEAIDIQIEVAFLHSACMYSLMSRTLILTTSHHQPKHTHMFDRWRACARPTSRCGGDCCTACAPKPSSRTCWRSKSTAGPSLTCSCSRRSWNSRCVVR